MNRPLLFACCLPAALAANPAETFQIQCAACHLVDQSLVGPSLVEISRLYRDDIDGFVRWCVEPGRKRLDRIAMPAMVHVGEPALREIHAHILKLSEGKTEKAVPEADPYTVPPSELVRPQVQRIFLPEASPAAIAVALPGDLSYCFDAAECRLRYVWRGGFILGAEHWKGNGSALAAIDGQIVYREAAFPLKTSGDSQAPKFLGYRVKDGLPSFRYERDGVRFTETIRPLPDGSGIERRFETDGSRPLQVADLPGAGIEAPGETLDAASAKSFTLTLRWK